MHALRLPGVRATYLCATALALSACLGTAQAAPTATCAGREQPTTRFLLQQVTATGAILRWRGDADAVCIGTSRQALDRHATARTESGHRQVRFSGLQPDTVYHYSIGGAATAPESQWFRTAPVPGRVPADGNTRIWLIGDSGTATELSKGKLEHPGEAAQVRDAFLAYSRAQGGEPLDLLLLLGDNAYLDGSDAQWQGAFFDVYRDLLASTPVLPTIGNHEMGMAAADLCRYLPPAACIKGVLVRPASGLSEASDPASYDSDGDGPDAGGMPYLSIFALPTAAEAGGVPSGTEQYYAVDQGNVHIVSLDSQLSNRDPAQRAAMREWLIADLGANKADWTVVIFHHPPYSRGKNHDSDIEQAEIDMRRSFGPVFEAHGVDVVYSGHAHSYERSWYLHGHAGDAASFDARAHAALGADGTPALGQGDAPYRQADGVDGADESVVYTVAGSAGKADGWSPCVVGQQQGCTHDDWLTHPAHRRFDAGTADARPHGLAVKGSVVIDAGRHTLRSRFIDASGTVRDEFTITR